MYKLVLFTLLVLAQSTIVLKPDNEQTGNPISIIWIQGADCKPESYQEIAREFIQEAARGRYQPGPYQAYVAIPEFVGNTPEPVLFDHYVDQALADLKAAGASNINVFLAAHSLGGVMSQINVLANPNKFLGLITMGSVPLRKYRELNDEGKTGFQFQIPFLSLTGSKDGLLRITRANEAFWHSHMNVNSTQVGQFPVVALEGVSHASFMDEMESKDLPYLVRSKDLRPEVSSEQAHKMITSTMMEFIEHVWMNNLADWEKTETYQTSLKFFTPLLDAMQLEGSYHMKEPCYNKSLVNDFSDVRCTTGSDWVQQAQVMMGGDLTSHINLKVVDNFHRVYTVTPVHLPEVNHTCNYNSSDDCQLQSITVTENYYDRLSPLDTGMQPNAALEQKAKLMSRQSIQKAIGVYAPDFHVSDEVGNRCGEINQKALEWAYNHSSQTARDRYDSIGNKLVIGDDQGPYNEGPLWIWHYLNYTSDAKNNQTILSSPMMRTPTDYFISAAAGFHYCKLISPYRAMEWIYVDGLFQNDNVNNESVLEWLSDKLKFNMLKEQFVNLYKKITGFKN